MGARKSLDTSSQQDFEIKPVPPNEVKNFVNMVCRQLPSMPRYYVQEMIDTNKYKPFGAFSFGSMIGGIMWRSFKKDKFAELAFVVVSTRSQEKGVGRCLIHALKADCANNKIAHVLTYGDLNSTDFFNKMGFSEKIKLAKKKFNTKISHYDGSTLMCLSC